MNVRTLGTRAGAAWQLARRRRAAPGAVVLAYHDVETDGDERWSVTPRQLRDHVRLLDRLGLTVVTVEDLVARHAAGDPLDDLAAITFDDALLGVRHHAVDVLGGLGVPATVFVVDGAAPDAPTWWPGARRCLATAELAELIAAGWSVGSHTATHRSLPTLDDAELVDELASSRSRLAERLGTPVAVLAYPSGHHDRRVRDAAEAAGFDAAFTFLNGRIAGPEDRFRLPRLTMGRHASGAWLAMQLARRADRWPDHQLDAVHADVNGGGSPR